MALEIQVLAWDRHTIVSDGNRLMASFLMHSVFQNKCTDNFSPIKQNHGNYQVQSMINYRELN